MVEDREIRELNVEYRGKDYATDVLSFPMLEEFEPAALEGAILLGDVVISAETAMKQAEELGVSFERRGNEITLSRGVASAWVRP